MASIHSGLRRVGLVIGMIGLLFAAQAGQAGVGLPQLERGKGERCVEDTQFMRRNHMELLKHHRDKTVHQGIRTPRHSLKGCVEGHASAKTGSVAASKDDFCAACHVYTGVKLDCWDCHATKPGKRPAQSGLPTTMSQPSPLLADPAHGGY